MFKEEQKKEDVHSKYQTLAQDPRWIEYFSKYNDSLAFNKLKTKGDAKIRDNDGKNGFLSGLDFVDWWIGTWLKQEGKCYYCLSEFSQIALLIEKNLLHPRKIKHGYRGFVPEIERLNTNEGFNIYSRENCALSCYYCNNDKSYVYSSDDYKKYFGPAKREFIQALLKRIV